MLIVIEGIFFGDRFKRINFSGVVENQSRTKGEGFIQSNKTDLVVEDF